MNFDQYEQFVDDSNQGELEDRRDLVYNVMQLASEAGEVASLFAKNRGAGHYLMLVHVTEELGDLLWHLTRLSKQLGSSLTEVAKQNMVKVKTRHPEGFTVNGSMNRRYVSTNPAMAITYIRPGPDTCSCDTDGSSSDPCFVHAPSCLLYTGFNK